MIEPRYNALADAVFTRYLHGLFRRHFHQIRLLGPLPELRGDLPVLLLPNHSTWWDGFFVHLLNRLFLRRRISLVMLQEQLEKNSLFRSLGAAGFDPGSGRDILAMLRWARATLEADRYGRTLLVLYPQGEMHPVDKRPLGVRPGAGWLIQRTRRPVTVLPLAMRVDMLADQRPDVSLAFGDPFVTGPDEKLTDPILEAALEAALDRLTSSVQGNGPELEPTRILVHGRRSVNDWWEGVRRTVGLSATRERTSRVPS